MDASTCHKTQWNIWDCSDTVTYNPPKHHSIWLNRASTVLRKHYHHNHAKYGGRLQANVGGGLPTDLLSSNFAGGEVRWSRVREIESWYGGGGTHGQWLGQRDADLISTQQLPHRQLLRVIRLSGITRRRPNTLKHHQHTATMQSPGASMMRYQCTRYFGLVLPDRALPSSPCLQGESK